MLSLPQAEHVEQRRDIEFGPRILNVLFKRKWWLVVCTLAVAVPVGVMTYRKAPEYETSAKVFVRNARADPTLSPIGVADRTIAVSVTPTVINSEIQILKSLDLVKQTIEKTAYPLLKTPDDATPGEQERALQGVLARLSVTPVVDSNVIDVKFRDGDPARAAGFVNTLTTLYLDKHTQVHRGARDAAGFFEDQAGRYAAQFEKTRQAVVQFQDDAKIIDLGDEMTQNLNRLFALEAQLKDIQGQIEGAEKETRVLEQLIAELPDEQPTQRTITTNPEVTLLRTRLIDLERQRDELLSRYTPNSRLVVDKEAEIAALRERLGVKQETIVDATIVARNSTKENLRQQLMAKASLTSSLEGRKHSLIRETTSYSTRLELLKGKSHEYAKLRQENAIARENFLLYRKKSEEARIAVAMDEQKLINTGIMQNAPVPVLPTGRGLTIAVAFGTIAGLALGVGSAFTLEFFNSSVQHESDIERFLQVPVLATIREF